MRQKPQIPTIGHRCRKAKERIGKVKERSGKDKKKKKTRKSCMIWQGQTHPQVGLPCQTMLPFMGREERRDGWERERNEKGGDGRREGA